MRNIWGKLLCATAIVVLVASFAVVWSRQTPSLEFEHQLDVYEHPMVVKMHTGEKEILLQPHESWVVLCTRDREELRNAFVNPDESVRYLKEQPRYIFLAKREDLKDINELRTLAKEGRLCAIHVVYTVAQDNGLVLVILPVPVVASCAVEGQEAAFEQLVKRHDLTCVPSTSEKMPNTYEFGGVTKYAFVFDVAAKLTELDCVEFCMPAIIVLTSPEVKDDER